MFCFKTFIFLFFFYICFLNFFLFKLIYLNTSGEKFSELFFSWGLDNITFLFLFMVFLVTSLVLAYSEFYMEHYNNKKFFFLTLSFLLSMVVLSSSSGIMNFMIGWDGLGISSLCLIMFYSNKTTLFNSFLTFFFNRLGDVILLIVFSFFFLSPGLIFFESSNLDFFVCLLLVFCSFTKSAQFPLSSWLPAAMSAPTPISAMVHSSTLVTAGVFLLMKIYIYLNFYNLVQIFGLFSLTTFLLGGFLANSELDLKKIVAFSTMSQISMIILILSMGFLFFSLAHTMTHALFKTLLFCACGVSFLFNFSNQLSLTAGSAKSNFSVFNLLVFSTFSMSGLIFSSSFFTKDVILEFLLGEHFLFIFLLFSIGGVFTILYSSSILDCFSSPVQSNSSSMFGSKKFFFLFMIFFTILTLWVMFLILEVFPASIFPILEFGSLLILVTFMLIPLFLTNFYMKKNFSFLNFENSYSKFFVFSLSSYAIKMDKFSFQFSDQYFAKPFFFSFNFKFKNFDKISFYMFPVIFFLFIYFN